MIQSGQVCFATTWQCYRAKWNDCYEKTIHYFCNRAVLPTNWKWLHWFVMRDKLKWRSVVPIGWSTSKQCLLLKITNCITSQFHLTHNLNITMDFRQFFGDLFHLNEDLEQFFEESFSNDIVRQNQQNIRPRDLMLKHKSERPNSLVDLLEQRENSNVFRSKAFNSDHNVRKSILKMIISM